MLKLIFTLALLAASAVTADAGQCQTTCTSYGNQTNCTRTCW